MPYNYGVISIMSIFVFLSLISCGCLLQSSENGSSVPIIDISSTKVEVNETISISGSRSYSNKSFIREYSWSIENEDGDIWYQTKNESFQYSFNTPGQYYLKLSIRTTDRRTSSTSKILNVTPILFSEIKLKWSYEISYVTINDSRVLNISEESIFLEVIDGRIETWDGHIINKHIVIDKYYFVDDFDLKIIDINDHFSIRRSYYFYNLEIWNENGIIYCNGIRFDRTYDLGSINATLDYQIIPNIPKKYQNGSYIFKGPYMDDQEYWDPDMGNCIVEYTEYQINRKGLHVVEIEWEEMFDFTNDIELTVNIVDRTYYCNVPHEILLYADGRSYSIQIDGSIPNPVDIDFIYNQWGNIGGYLTEIYIE